MTAQELLNRQRKQKKRKIRWTAFGLVLVLLFVLFAGAGISELNHFSLSNDTYHGTGKLPNDIHVGEISSVANAASLRDFLKQWSQNDGDKMSSQYVHNILLLGIDSDSKLSDTMILVSVNERTRQTHMVSFYRDSYTYLPKGTGGTYCKLNAAYAYGGAAQTVKTIEDDYKFKINRYFLVDYDTFPKAIDALGGVDVKVTKKEAKYLNKTWKKWTRTHKKIQFHDGLMHMDGEHALMFCRIRKLDSDIGRTNRQRRVMTAILNQVKNADLEGVNQLMDSVKNDIKTDMPEREREALAARLIKGHWQTYPVAQLTMPDEKTGKEGYAGDQWIWIVDYEQAAHKLQNALYGQSNIELPKDRSKPLEM